MMRYITTMLIAMLMMAGAARAQPGDDVPPGTDAPTQPPPPRDERMRDDDGPRRGPWRGDRGMMRDRRFGDDDKRFGDRDRGHGGPHGDRDFQMSEEQMDEVLGVLEDYRPEMAEKLRELRERDPHRAEQFLRRAMMFVRPMLHMKKTDPQGYELKLREAELDRESQKLARQLRAAEGDEADELRERLRDVIAEHFDVRQEIRERELARLEQRIAELREQINARLDARGELIDERYAELTGQSGEPEW